MNEAPELSYGVEMASLRPMPPFARAVGLLGRLYVPGDMVNGHVQRNFQRAT
jgi:hypothetical protein